MTYPDGMVLDYQYDQLNRMTGVESGGTTIVSYTYDLMGKVKRRELQNGTYTTYNYDESSLQQVPFWLRDYPGNYSKLRKRLFFRYQAFRRRKDARR